MTIFRRALLGATACLAAAPVLAQETPAPAPAAPPAAAAPAAVRDVDPALWVVRDEDTTVYLFGTVHVLKPGLGWFDEAVREAFDEADTLAIEMIEPAPADMQALVTRTALDTTGRPISGRLSPERREQLTAALASVGAPANAVDPFEPWFASTMVALMPLPALGYDPASGVEQQLKSAAAAAGKPVVALETADEQIGFLDGLSEPSQMAMLDMTIADFDEIGPLFDRMIASWGAGDADGLAALMNEQMDEVPEVAETLLFDRNERWAQWIADRMAQPGTVFMAVGAGHLAGDKSVQQALAGRGIEATRVDY